MLTVFEKKWNREAAIFLSSLLFGAGHLIGQKMGLRDFLIMALSASLIGAILAIVTFITEKYMVKCSYTHGVEYNNYGA